MGRLARRFPNPLLRGGGEYYALGEYSDVVKCGLARIVTIFDGGGWCHSRFRTFRFYARACLMLVVLVASWPGGRRGWSNTHLSVFWRVPLVF